MVDALADDPVQINWLVDRFRSLNFVERHARTEAFTPEQRLAPRQEKPRPVVELMAQRLDTLAGTSILPQSSLGKVLSYARNEWVAWTRFLQDGRMEIDNHLTYAARGITPVIEDPESPTFPVFLANSTRPWTWPMRISPRFGCCGRSRRKGAFYSYPARAVAARTWVALPITYRITALPIGGSAVGTSSKSHK